MKIIIAGAGEVGTHLAKLLSREEQDIILIDNDEEKLRELDANYNLMTIVGKPHRLYDPETGQGAPGRPVYRRHAV